MTYTINSSSTSFQALTLANINAPPTQIDNTSNNVSPATSSTSSNNESFVQNVLQSLQSLGLNTNTTDVNSNEAVQVFVQNLSKVLAQGSSPQLSVVDGELPSTVGDTPTKFSGGTNFRYSVDLSGAQLGDNLTDVSANIKTALDNIGQFISSKIVFDLQVLTKSVDNNTLAQAGAALVTSTTPNPNGSDTPIKSIDTSFVADSISGVDSSPNAPDATLYINLTKMDQMSFSGLPTPDKYDFTSIVTHEILHGLAFAGTLTVNPPLQTVYDTLIAPQPVAPPNAPSVFVGRHAKTINAGEPVSLSPASSGQGSAYYHVALPADLMSESISKGEVKSISALDVAMLEDMGISVTGVSPAPSKVQTAYNDPTANLQKLMTSLNSDNGQNSALQADFTKVVESFGGSTSSTKLQDFLTQLSINTVNGNSLQPSSGALFSATA